jgi:RNA polymerase sigma-70 factor (ECF subfamily)
MTSAAIESTSMALSSKTSQVVPSWRPVTLDETTLVGAYGAHRGAAYNAYQILHDGADAEDAVQDAFVKLWTGAAQFDPSRGSMRGLLLTITRHMAIDVIRKRARRQRTESIYCTEAGFVSAGPERAVECADDARHVTSALRELPDEQRRAFEMAYFLGLTRCEIPTSASVPVGTVKSRMRLGMKKLALGLGGWRP